MINKQAGGIVSFVIVGVMLAGLLGAGLYFGKNMGREARNAAENTAQVAGGAKEAVEEKVTEEKNEEKAEVKKEAAGTPAPQTQGTSSTRTNTPSANTGAVASTGPSDSVPATGPAETFATVAALSGLTFAGYMYSSARRGVRSSALSR
jgi:hypothetical protein